MGEVRGIGLIAGVELVTDKAKKTALEVPGQLGTMVGKVLQDLGVISRNIRDTVAFCPPLIITVEQVDEMVSKFKEALDTVYKNLNA